MGFADAKIENFAKLHQKEAKDTLEREKQVRLEKRNSKKKHNKENTKNHHPARKIQMFYRMMLMIPKTPLLYACMYCEIQYCHSAVEWVKCRVREQWACPCSQCAHLGKKRV